MKFRKINLFSLLLIIVLLIFTACGSTGSQDDSFSGEISAHFIDVGHGDAIVVELREEDSRYIMLIDAGPELEDNPVVSYLEDMNVSRIDLMVATHPHQDHIGGMVDVINNFEITKVIDSGIDSVESDYYLDYIAALEENNIEMIIGRNGMSIELVKDINFEIIHPTGPPSDDSSDIIVNNYSVTGQIRYNQIGFLFTGDIQREAEEKILNRRVNIENEILKVAHHGSISSSTSDFIDKVKPEVAVIQCPEGLGGTSYLSLPNDEVIERLKNSGAEVYRNDYHGNIVVNTDGLSYSIDLE